MEELGGAEKIKMSATPRRGEFLRARLEEVCGDKTHADLIFQLIGTGSTVITGMIVVEAILGKKIGLTNPIDLVTFDYLTVYHSLTELGYFLIPESNRDATPFSPEKSLFSNLKSNCNVTFRVTTKRNLKKVKAHIRDNPLRFLRNYVDHHTFYAFDIKSILFMRHTFVGLFNPAHLNDICRRMNIMEYIRCGFTFFASSKPYEDSESASSFDTPCQKPKNFYDPDDAEIFHLSLSESRTMMDENFVALAEQCGVDKEMVTELLKSTYFIGELVCTAMTGLPYFFIGSPRPEVTVVASHARDLELLRDRGYVQSGSPFVVSGKHGYGVLNYVKFSASDTSSGISSSGTSGSIRVYIPNLTENMETSERKVVWKIVKSIYRPPQRAFYSQGYFSAYNVDALKMLRIDQFLHCEYLPSYFVADSPSFS